jgi:hypothetical protein
MSGRIIFLRSFMAGTHFEILTASPEIFICSSLFVENASIAWTPGYLK